MNFFSILNYAAASHTPWKQTRARINAKEQSFGAIFIESSVRCLTSFTHVLLSDEVEILNISAFFFGICFTVPVCIQHSNIIRIKITDKYSLKCGHSYLHNVLLKLNRSSNSNTRKWKVCARVCVGGEGATLCKSINVVLIIFSFCQQYVYLNIRRMVIRFKSFARCV